MHTPVDAIILETSELKITDDYNEIAEACGLANECGVDFIKTSTGFSSYGARVEDLKIMREHLLKKLLIVQ